MFKKTITYTDFNDVEHTQDFYFHLTKMRLLELVGDGTLQDKIQQMVAAKDNVQILRKITEVVRLSIGVRTDDGAGFIQNDQVTEKLAASPAFDELLVELVSDPEKSAEFIKQLVPKDMQKQMAAELKVADPFKNPPNPISNVGISMADIDNRPAWIKEDREPTSRELQFMSADELRDVYARKLKDK
jgi:hypothetical protein